MRLWVMGALVLAVGGTVVASNMGFKFVPNYSIGGGTKRWTISLPTLHNYNNGRDIYNDIVAACPGGGTSVIRKTPTQLPISCTGGVGAFCNQLLNVAPGFAGEGYEVVIGPVGGCAAWVVVGSHDPSFIYTFANPGQVYITSIPYHTTAVNAKDIRDSIPNCDTVHRINNAQIPTTYAGVGPAFAVTIGEALYLKIKLGFPNQQWTPPHY